MSHYEYKVIPAPVRADKVKGVKTPEGRFARTVESELNRMGEAGWEYLRAELLPNEERSGLKAAQTKWRTVLIFRRRQDTEAETLHARVLDAPALDPVPDPVVPVLGPMTADAADDHDPPLVTDKNVVTLPPRDVDDDDTPR